MRYEQHIPFVIAMALTGCPSGDAGVGESCERHDDCDSALQCVTGTCGPRCQRAPECGDGYTCDDEGICRIAEGQPGDACTSETACAPGLACQIDGAAMDALGRLRASCAAQNAATTRPFGSTCVTDDDCRNGTCALGLIARRLSKLP